MSREYLPSASSRAAVPVTSGGRRRRPPGTRLGENPRPPRYRLLAAAAALPQREPVRPTESFDRACPACGQVVRFTQTESELGVEYSIEDHDCRE